MSITGYKKLDGTPQLDCQVRKTIFCKLGIHFPRIQETNMKRCSHCNHIKFNNGYIEELQKEYAILFGKGK